MASRGARRDQVDGRLGALEQEVGYLRTGFDSLRGRVEKLEKGGRFVSVGFLGPCEALWQRRAPAQQFRELRQE